MNTTLIGTAGDRSLLEALQENSPGRVVTVVLASILSICSALLSAGTIWYEYYGTDNYRYVVVKKTFFSLSLSFEQIS